MLGHHNQTTGQVPQRKDGRREGADHERADHGPVHGPHHLRGRGHPRRVRQPQDQEGGPNQTISFTAAFKNYFNDSRTRQIFQFNF